MLADFGVSRFSDEGLKRELAVEPTMATDVTTSSKVLLGTTSYLAPEVKRGEAATAKSDMYSLGVMLFRMLTGIWYEPGTGAMNLLGPFDPAWKEILSALLDEDPAKRSMSPRRRRRARLVFLAALCAVLALAAAAAVAWSLAGRSASSRGDAGKSLPAQGRDGRALDDLFFVTK
jgi:serine/threonine-protein kinase